MTAAPIAAAIALTATPARVQLDGAGRATVQVTNRGRSPVTVDVARAGFALDLRGRPRIVAAASAAWLSATPTRVTIAPGDAAALTVAARTPRGASPGDHAALLLLSTRPPRGGAIAVRARLGVVVVLRVPGRIVRRLTVAGLRARRRTVTVQVANRGNVAEMLTGVRLQVTLWRRGRLVARLRPQPRELLPRTRGLVELRYRGALRGAVIARVRLAGRSRAFRLRL